MNKVYVAGSINMDIVSFSNRMPKKGETIFGEKIEYFAGGKGANQAVASAKFGVDTVMFGSVGQDSFSSQLIDFLNTHAVNTENIVKTESSHTGTAVINVTPEDNSIIVIPGANNQMVPQNIDYSLLNKGDVLVSQFEIPEDTITDFFEKGKSKGCITVLNAAPAKKVNNTLLDLVDVLIVNETELACLTDSKLDDSSSIEELAKQASNLASTPDQLIIVTLGANGAICISGQRTIKVDGKVVDIVDTTGAGDCFVGNLAACIASKWDIDKSIDFSNLAASLSVQKEGAGVSMPSKEEVDEHASNSQ